MFVEFSVLSVCCEPLNEFTANRNWSAHWVSGGRVTHNARPETNLKLSQIDAHVFFFRSSSFSRIRFRSVFCVLVPIVLWLRCTRCNAIRVQIFHVFNLVGHIVWQIRARALACSVLYLFCCCCCSGHWPHDSRNHHHHHHHHHSCMHRVDSSPHAYITTGLLLWGRYASAAHTVLFVHATSCAFRTSQSARNKISYNDARAKRKKQRRRAHVRVHESRICL